MDKIVHATFANAQDGIRAVESLLHHGVRADDINLILPKRPPIETPTAHIIVKTDGASVKPSVAQESLMPAMSRSARDGAGATLLSEPPRLSPSSERDAAGPHAQGFNRSEAPASLSDGTGAASHGAKKAKPVTTPIGSCHECVVDAEQGAGLGLVVGLLTALCVPNIGMIGGGGPIVAELMAAATTVGGLAGGLYGYLIDRGVDRDVARKVSDHLAEVEASLSVNVSGTLKVGEIAHILKQYRGRVIRHPHQERM
jgi:uncharacterized membrane protein